MELGQVCAEPATKTPEPSLGLAQGDLRLEGGLSPSC